MLRQRRLSFYRSRCQARFRGEPWSLTLDQYESIWPREIFTQKGRGPGTLVMGRRDPSEGWHLANVMVMERMANQARVGEWKRNKGLTSKVRLFKIREKEK